ncbi:MAG: NAD(P)H-binding protein [Marinomonas sp.]
MSNAAKEPLQIALIGATGLVGRMVMEAVIGREDVRLTAIARREVPLPKGVRMEMIISKPGRWGDVLEEIQPTAMICALGTTWKRAGKDEQAFRAVDQELVLNSAKVAKEKGVERFVVVTSVGANVGSRSLYLRVKGEVERDLAMLKFKRLDILHPGLLKGARIDDRRAGEGIAQALSPVMNVMMHGPLKDMRSIDARNVAAGALALASRKPGGRFTHNNEAIMRAAREWSAQE